jgi:hydrogenase nickel incorporation protein HypB
MCSVCGCGNGEVRIGGEEPDRSLHHHTQDGGHDHCHGHHHLEDHDHHRSSEVAGERRTRLVAIEQDILAKNDSFAARNRVRLDRSGILGLNLMASPGAGKTALLTATVAAMVGHQAVGVIEGDQETENDAERIRATGVPAVQINTGRGCHLDAHMVGHALDELALGADGVLFIENVGNLVCPAAFDLGEHHKVAILSVAEGDDKPLKYPDMFMAADLMILNKVDLLPYVDFDVARCVEFAQRVNPQIEVLELSARTGAGLDRWIAWIEAAQSRIFAHGRPADGAAASEEPAHHA